MRKAVQRLIAAESTQARLADMVEQAPAAAPVSLRLPLPRTGGDWLNLLPAAAPWWYRARPDRGEFRLAIGHALHVASNGAQRFAALDNAWHGFCRQWRGDRGLAFAGFAFDAGGDRPLPNALLAIPAMLLEAHGDAATLTLTAPAGRIRQALAECAAWLAPGDQPRAPATLALSAGSAVEPLVARAWIARVEAALREIGQGQVAKLVLSRSRALRAASPFRSDAILGNLVRQQPGSVVYGHGDSRHAFVGATPERLVRLAAGHVDADALAGTAWPGSPTLADAKNRREQALVVDAVRTALAPLCDAMKTGAATAHAAGRMQHLRSRISGTVRPGTTLFDLVRALHPTPAVAGTPGDAALAWLHAHGERRAGWYAGGFGVLTADGDGEFSVALRSALIDGETAILQAGAGIVADSDPLHELAETEVKLGTLLAALAAAPVPETRRA